MQKIKWLLQICLLYKPIRPGCNGHSSQCARATNAVGVFFPIAVNGGATLPHYYKPMHAKLFSKLLLRFPQIQTFWEHWLRGFIGLVLIGGFVSIAFLISAVVVAFVYFVDQLLPSELMLEDQYKRLFVFALAAVLAPYLYSMNYERIEEALKKWKTKSDRKKSTRSSR